MRKHRRSAPFVFILGIVGLIPLMRNPRFETFHTVDVLQLLASGACFGIALTLFVVSLRSSRAE